MARGLAVLLLEFGCVGHGETGSVDQEGAVSVPAAFVRRGDRQAGGDVSEQVLVEGQGQAAAGLAVGDTGAVELGQSRDVVAGGVAVEDLQGEELDGGGGVEEAVPPAVAQVGAELVDGLGTEPPGDRGLLNPIRNVRS
jgi:hypothetical protein